MRKLVVPLGLAILSALAAPIPTAEACGMFVPSIRDLDAAVPKLSIEQALLIFDDAKQREHFIREIRVDGGNRDFGFVVPTPTKPEIAKVAKGLFSKLEDKVPYDPPRPKGGPPGNGGASRGADMSAGAPPPVAVIETKKVGSFTATVLLATDADALRNWLKSNGFAAPDTTQSWINRYVKLGFYFVAFRFDGKAGADAGTLVSETVRLSFDTPQLYYPYLEPSHEGHDGQSSPPERLLLAWTITPAAARPISSVSVGGGEVTFFQPWRAGAQYTDGQARKAVTPDVAKLLPAGKFVLQTWRDTRTSRTGLGDILFAPTTPVELDAAAREKRKALLPVLDPSLLEGDAPVSVQR